MFSFNTSPGCCTLFIESFALLGICDKDRKPNQIYFRSAVLTFLFLLYQGEAGLPGVAGLPGQKGEKGEKVKYQLNPLFQSLSVAYLS